MNSQSIHSFCKNYFSINQAPPPNRSKGWIRLVTFIKFASYLSGLFPLAVGLVYVISKGLNSVRVNRNPESKTSTKAQGIAQKNLSPKPFEKEPLSFSTETAIPPFLQKKSSLSPIEIRGEEGFPKENSVKVNCSPESKTSTKAQGTAQKDLSPKLLEKEPLSFSTETAILPFVQKKSSLPLIEINGEGEGFPKEDGKKKIPPIVIEDIPLATPSPSSPDPQPIPDTPPATTEEKIPEEKPQEKPPQEKTQEKLPIEQASPLPINPTEASRFLPPPSEPFSPIITPCPLNSESTPPPSQTTSPLSSGNPPIDAQQKSTQGISSPAGLAEALLPSSFPKKNGMQEVFPLVKKGLLPAASPAKQPAPAKASAATLKPIAPAASPQKPSTSKGKTKLVDVFEMGSNGVQNLWGFSFKTDEKSVQLGLDEGKEERDCSTLLEYLKKSKKSKKKLEVIPEVGALLKKQISQKGNRFSFEDTTLHASDTFGSKDLKLLKDFPFLLTDIKKISWVLPPTSKHLPPLLKLCGNATEIDFVGCTPQALEKIRSAFPKYTLTSSPILETPPSSCTEEKSNSPIDPKKVLKQIKFARSKNRLPKPKKRKTFTMEQARKVFEKEFNKQNKQEVPK